MYSTSRFCQILIKLEFIYRFFEKHSNIKFHENSFSLSRVLCGQRDGQTDMTKLIVAYRRFANAPKNRFFLDSSWDLNPSFI